MKPIKLSPAFKDYLWGGTKLRTEFNKNCDFEKVAESWELSTHKDGQSVVLGGEYGGLKLSEYVDKAGKGVLGTNAEKFEYFPILIKLIDAKDSLSIQVHPSDEYALKVEGEYGKTEMWYIVDCEEDAYLYYGFNRDITPEEFKERIENNTVLEVLNRVDVKKGDVFFIESGTVHAIGAGIVICEIQQNSNTTYRVYDYDRRDKNGNPRELHIDKAVEVSNTKKAPKLDGGKVLDDGLTLLADCKYFKVLKAEISGRKEFTADEKSFNSVIILDGEGKLCCRGEELAVKKGDSVFVPANLGEYVIDGDCTAIISMV